MRILGTMFMCMGLILALGCRGEETRKPVPPPPAPGTKALVVEPMMVAVKPGGEPAKVMVSGFPANEKIVVIVDPATAGVTAVPEGNAVLIRAENAAKAGEATVTIRAGEASQKVKVTVG